jgi:hypothetical protein
MRFLSFYLASVVCVVLCWAGLAKLRTPIAIRRASLARLGVIIPAIRGLVALSLPWLELVAGVFSVAVLFPALWYVSHVAVAAMFTLFTAVVAIEWSRGKPIRCGCFGEAEATETDPRFFFTRNLVLIVISLTAATLHPGDISGLEILLALLMALGTVMASVIVRSVFVVSKIQENTL